MFIACAAIFTLTISAADNCGVNEKYSACGSEGTVDNPNPPVTPGCQAGCFCMPGTLRDIDGSCVDAAADPTKAPPVKPCTAGGCGSSSCTISQDYPGGLGASKSITADPGNFACCWKTGIGDLGARAYPNSMCPGY
ncbi:trypsin inhibitor-like cysteine-rich domain-containing protein [Sphingobacterium siyangense]|uniref:trypsin inhibitor-like cysteine-rich domain-containing protein n=1 Tax=Sphingobacterium siyangense TaxID=459529 RepID=UPI001963F0BE|nr:trypsin inhibitor-like cysteine-rich domain-containing protein [Sphingobacterium siyangense]QRY58808.1 trypsin inhibitor-like cysteine-rich domain-containing protein [Sphingobacterium siyangense]